MVKRRIYLTKRVFLPAALLVTLGATFAAQSRIGTIRSISSLAVEGRLPEAVALAVQNPDAAEGAVRNLIDMAGMRIAEGRIDEARSQLEAVLAFSDSYDKTAGPMRSLSRRVLEGRRTAAEMYGRLERNQGGVGTFSLDGQKP